MNPNTAVFHIHNPFDNYYNSFRSDFRDDFYYIKAKCSQQESPCDKIKVNNK